jgi:hypothetical protein
MKSRNSAFSPSIHGLEPRVLLSRAAGSRAALISASRAAGESPRHLQARTKVNLAFDSFKADYMKAFDVYLQALATPGTNVQTAQAAFSSFITERGNLLSQQLVPTMARVPGSLARLLPSQRSAFGNSISTPLQAFLLRRITGGANGGFSSALVPTLKTLIPNGGTTAPEAELLRLTAANSIEAARRNTFNAAGLANAGTFTPAEQPH